MAEQKNFAPMLASLAAAPFDDPEWVYEIKWDGFRALSVLKGMQVNIFSRNSKSFDDKFYPIHEALAKIGIHAVLDGELVVLDRHGRSDFSALQNWRSEADGALVYYVFDLLSLDGKDLTEKSLLDRREALKGLLGDNDYIRLSAQTRGTGHELFKTAVSLGLEGLMAKKASSLYKPGERSKEWLKIKIDLRQDVVIGGYTRNEGSSKKFSALLVGTFEGNEFISRGTVGTGFSAKNQQEMLDILSPLVIEQSPFKVMPEFNKPSRFRPHPPKATVTWVKPETVIEVSYKDSGGGSLRQASFKRIRTDKTAAEAMPEIGTIPNLGDGSHISLNPVNETGRKTLLNPKDESQVRCIDNHDLKFSNLGKVFWPEQGYTKRDLINYYYQAAPFILPYLTGRPQSLNRFPNGISAPGFYQKDVTGKVPSWIETFSYFSEADAREKHFFVCTDEASLLYMISLGCIEVNPWSSSTGSTDHPDWCIIDLDPDKNSFDEVIETALLLKSVLDEIKVPCYCKTSGSTGLHIYIPLGGKYTYEQSKEFARRLARIINHEQPDNTSIERTVAKRNGKMYIDFLQNRPQATIAAPYSVRPKPGATVSTPLHWDEVKKGLSMKDFHLGNAIARFRSEGDLFSGVLGKGINLDEAVQALEYRWSQIFL